MGDDEIRVRPPGPHIAAVAVDETGTVTPDIDRAGVEQMLADGQFFWLDMPGLGPDEVEWLRDVFRFHQLAIEDAREFNERPKAEEYDGYIAWSSTGRPRARSPEQRPARPLPAWAARGRRRGAASALSEVHCFVSARYIVTVHRADCPALRGWPEREAHPAAMADGPGPHLLPASPTPWSTASSRCSPSSTTASTPCRPRSSAGPATASCTSCSTYRTCSPSAAR